MGTFVLVSSIILILALVFGIISIISSVNAPAVTIQQFTLKEEDIVAKACKLYDMRLDDELMCGMIPTYEEYLEAKNAFRRDLFQWNYNGSIEDILIDE